MEFWIKAAQLILSLSILVFLHELGHYIPAKLFKTRVEKFYLFFNPWFSLFKFKRGDTEWGLGWLPLGGYVKIAGMIDESMDSEQMKKPAEPWEFRSKPAWQRLIIMLGGVTVNFIVGFFLFIMVMWVWGKDYLPIENTTYGVHVNVGAMKGEERVLNGDHILTVGGQKPLTLGEAGIKILIEGEREMEILRNGEIKKIILPDDINNSILAKSTTIFDARIPFVVSEIKSGMGAEKAGLKIGDSIVGINDSTGLYFQEISLSLAFHKSENVIVHLYRNNELITQEVSVNKDGYIGIVPSPPTNFLTYRHIDYTFFEAIPAGISEAGSTISRQVKSLGLLFSSAGAKQIGGFGTMGSIFSPVWDWHSFWLLTALISIVLAVMNLLPIPALDGGHVMFLIYEMITGRAPGQRFMEIAQTIGMILLLGLILFANGNDIFKFFF